MDQGTVSSRARGRGRRDHHSLQDGDRRAAAKRLRRRAARQVQQDAVGRLPHPRSVHRAHRVQAQPEGAALDIPEQICITKDNVQVGIDGVLYLQVLDPARASYGIADYHFAISQLAQTTLRSEIGKIDLDRTFEERATINSNVVQRARQGLRAVGREGAALRDQEHQSAARRAPSDGEADARGAGEARRDLDVRRRARRQDQPGRGREAARHQGVRSQPAAADQRGGRRGRGDPRRRDGDGRRLAARRRGRQRRRRPRGDAAAHRRGVRAAVRQPREAAPTRSWCRRT